MVNPPIKPDFFQFADRLANAVSGGKGRLNTNDPQAVEKLMSHVDQKAAEFEQETGQPKEETFRDLFDRTAGRALGAAGRGALGAGRAVNENVIAPTGEMIGNTARPLAPAAELIDPDAQSIRAIDAATKTGASFGTEALVSPVVGPLLPEGNSFDQFAQELQRRRQDASLYDAITGQTSRDVFRESNLPTPYKIGAEIAFDPLNLAPGLGFAKFPSRAAQEGAEAAARTAGRSILRQTPEEVAQTAAQRTANEAIRAGDDLGEAASQAAARTAAQPQGPDSFVARIANALERRATSANEIPQELVDVPVTRQVPYRAIEAGVPSRELIDRAALSVGQGGDIDIARLPQLGRQQIIRRIELATRTGTQQVTNRGLRPAGVIAPDEASAMVQFVRALPDEYFADVALSIRGSAERNADFIAGTPAHAGGAFDPATGLIELFTRTIRSGPNDRIDDVFLHEVSHNLQRFVPEEDLAALRRQFDREKAMFEAGNSPATRLGDTPPNLAYRYSSFPEWFAETLTDRALRDLFPEELRSQATSTFGRVRNMAIGLYNWLLRKGRPDDAERVYRSLIRGENRVRLRSGSSAFSKQEADELAKLEQEVVAARLRKQSVPDDQIPDDLASLEVEVAQARQKLTQNSGVRLDAEMADYQRQRLAAGVDDVRVAEEVRAKRSAAEAEPAVQRIIQFLKDVKPAREALESDIRAARGQAAARGRAAASAETDPIRRSSRFVSAFAGTGQNTSRFDPIADVGEIINGLPKGVDSINPSEAAKLIGIGPEDFKNLYTAIDTKWPIGSRLEFNALDAKRGLTKALAGNIPSPAELKLLEQVFGTDLVKTLLSKRSLLTKVGEVAYDAAFLLPKSLRSSWDASAPLRQAVIFTLNPRHVRKTGESLWEMFQAGFRTDAEEFARGLYNDLVDEGTNPYAARMFGGKTKLSLHDLSGQTALQFTDREEVYASTLAELMPEFGKDVRTIFGRRVPAPVRVGIEATTLPVRVLGTGVRRSELMYATYLNQMRSRVATNVLKNWDEAAEATGRAIRQSDVDELMNAINVFTGRGNLPLGLDRITKPLSAVFWAPKLLASRFQAPLLAARGTVEGSAGVAARLFDASPESLLSRIANSPGARARQEMAKDLAAFVATGVTILGALKQFKIADVETDPRSSDFGKGKIGDLRFDFWGGFQQIARYTAQLASGETKVVSGENAGDIRRLGSFRNVEQEAATAARTGRATPPPDRMDWLFRFLQSKVAPGAPSLAANELRGQTFIGDTITDETALVGSDIGPTLSVREREAIHQLIPLFTIDLAEAIEDQGVAGGIGFGTLGALGTGISVFGDEGERSQQAIGTTSPTQATFTPVTR